MIHLKSMTIQVLCFFAVEAHEDMLDQAADCPAVCMPGVLHNIKAAVLFHRGLNTENSQTAADS